MARLDDTQEPNWAEIIGPIARELLGDPNKHLSTQKKLRFGRKGSLSVDLPKARWFDHEGGEGGGVLDLICREIGGDAKAAWQWLADRGYIGASVARLPATRKAKPKAAPAPKELDPETAAKSALAARQWAEARPIEGTPAELYLRRRGLDRWPASVRWCPAFQAFPDDPHPRPAIVFPVTDGAGAVIAVQAVRLTAEGRKIASRAKTSLGPVGSGFFRLLGRGPLHICEGPETALSVWLATGAPVFATCGPIAARRIETAPVVPAGLVVLCGDAAAPGSPAACSLEKATAAALDRGLSVRVAVPDGAPGTDWNDALQAAGADQVRAAIASAPVQVPASWGPATAAAPVGTVFDARRRVAEGFKTWTKNVLSYDPKKSFWGAPVTLMRVTTGIGKSHTARRAAADLVRKLRAAGDGRAVVLAVPRHNLGDEYAAALAEIAPDLVVQSYRGRSAPDPEAEGETMCRRADEAAAVQKAHGDVRSTLCRQGNDRCAFFEICGHNRQRAARADIWIVQHANLWQAKPAMIEAAALVIDEDPTNGAFGGFGAPVRLALDELAMPLTIRMEPGETADLAELSGRVASALRAGGDRVSLAAIKAEGLTTDDLGEARRLAFKAKIAPDARPSTPAADLAERLAQIGPHNRQAMRRARLFGLIKEAIEAGLEIVPGLTCETATAKDGETFRAVRMRWRNEIAAGWNVPTLIASATARPEVLRAIWPWLGDVIEADAASPFVSVRQITDRQFGAASLAPSEHAGTARHAFARNTRRRLRRYIEARAAEIGGRVLVIAQQRVIELLRAEGLPAAVATCHFNALSGLDQWRDVRLIIVIGRPMPAPGAVEDMAEVLTFSPIERVSGWYPVRAAHLDMKGTGEGPAIVTKRGKGAEATPGAPCHPDTLAEAIRWQICEGELLQAIGRGRGVNRDANSPLQIDVLCNLPLPIAVDEAGAFETLEPSARDLMAARGVVALDTSAKGAWAAVAAILPDVYATADAARDAHKARACSRGGIPIISLIGIPPRESGTARVKLAGARYAVAVRIRARSEAEARDMLARVLPGADLLDFVPPPEPALDLDAIEPVALPRIGSAIERMRIGAIVADLAVGSAIACAPVGAIMRDLAEGRRRIASG